MIARVWHGRTKPENTGAYEALRKPELLPGITKVKGYQGSYLLRRKLGDEVEFVTILLMDTNESIRSFAGPDYETSVIPEERRQYLSYHEPKAAHYEVVATREAAPSK